MTVISVHELTAPRRASVNEKHERTYTRVFQVRTNDKNDGPATAGGHALIPKLYDFYITPNEIDLAARVKEISPEQSSESPYLWTVSVNYDTKTEDQEDDPLNEPAEISWGFEQFSTICEKDIHGKAVVNSAGQYFDPPIEKDDSRPVLTVSRNEPTFIPSIAIDYQDAVNSDAFFGFSPGQVKVAGISASSAVTNNTSYWKVTYSFHLRREGFSKSILDQGRYRKSGTGLKEIMSKDAAGKDSELPISDPVPLDGKGAELPSPSPTNVVFLDFEVYKTRPFAPLNLP